MKQLLLQLLIASAALSVPHHAFAQGHGHLYVGAVARTNGAQLLFDNGFDFVSSNGYVKTLTYDTTTKYSNYFQQNITLTARALNAAGVPEPFAASAGTDIWASIETVEGPAGGEFAFWEEGATGPTIRVLSGGTNTSMFRLTSLTTLVSPTSDPFGHNHGRRFTATKAGIYKVAFKAWDRSTNGSNGGPIHTPSELLPIYFQAGLNIASITRSSSVATITYGSYTNTSFAVESSTNLLATNQWTVIGPVKNGDDLFQSQRDTNSMEMRFYRVVAIPIDLD
ncbi:MAG TPA: hypothetical protein VK530_02680 [Candidatus Acidoferrum sp.]|nr:hypothetical protein [Candidatus Acidoferrum sp.]